MKSFEDLDKSPHRMAHFITIRGRQWQSKTVQLWRNKNVHLPTPELKLSGCVDAGYGGVPHVARQIRERCTLLLFAFTYQSIDQRGLLNVSVILPFDQ